MQKRIKVSLHSEGINTDQFLSLAINKGDLPDGSSLVMYIKDMHTGELYPVNLSNADERRTFAKNSRFHGQTMQDGQIFNPYIHRRFIAAQFSRLVKRHGTKGLRCGVSSDYNWNYAIDVLIKEVHALANLQKRDYCAFQERQAFFTLSSVADIMDDYASAVADYLDHLRSISRGGNVHVPDYGIVESQNLRPMKHRFRVLANDVQQCMSYRQIDELLGRFDWLKLPDKNALSYSFVTPFIEAGAYFTLKHRVMFEGLRLWEKSQSDSLHVLRQHQGSYIDLYDQVG